MKSIKVNPHWIRTKKHRRDYFSAYVTWNGLDLSEIGETASSAVYLLLSRHLKHLQITEDDIPSIMNRLGFYPEEIKE